MPAKDLYKADYYAWAVHTNELLRSGRLAGADVTHITEEMDCMGVSEQLKIRSHLRVLLKHLLKWKYEPARRTPSWEATIRVQRLQISALLRTMPSLRRLLPELLPGAYQWAIIEAAVETRLPRSTFPAECPFTLRQIFDEDFFPEP